MEGAKEFVKYAVMNAKYKNLIVCLCKKCGMNRKTTGKYCCFWHKKG
jgi:hypothetical protein